MKSIQEIKAIFQALPIGIQNDLLEELLMEQELQGKVLQEAGQMSFSDLPEGYGFQFEVDILDTTENESKPILDEIVIKFE